MNLGIITPYAYRIICEGFTYCFMLFLEPLDPIWAENNGGIGHLDFIVAFLERLILDGKNLSDVPITPTTTHITLKSMHSPKERPSRLETVKIR